VIDNAARVLIAGPQCRTLETIRSNHENGCAILQVGTLGTGARIDFIEHASANPPRCSLELRQSLLVDPTARSKRTMALALRAGRGGELFDRDVAPTRGAGYRRAPRPQSWSGLSIWNRTHRVQTQRFRPERTRERAAGASVRDGLDRCSLIGYDRSPVRILVIINYREKRRSLGQRVRIIIVDDEPRFLAAWEMLIGSQTDMTVVGTFDCADQLIERAPDGSAVMLVDLSMPGRDPLTAVSELRSIRPELRAIIHSAYHDPDTAHAALECGAWGLVDKLASSNVVLDAIRRVAAGDVAFPPALLIDDTPGFRTKGCAQ
jgi:CheY-like chemotaxis protein